METLQQIQPSLVLFLGAPGAGKGAQSLLVKERFQFSRIEMSKLLEERFQKAVPDEYVEVGGTRYLFEEQKERWRTGLLCEDAFVAHILAEKIRDLHEKGERIVLDGFPRSVGQMKVLMPMLLDFYSKERITVIYIDISEQEAVRRNSNRRVCELMRHSILSNQETESLTMCPLDGSALTRRVFDDPETIRKRFEVFRDQTLPLLDYFREQGITPHAVQAEQSVADVFRHVSGIIEDQS